MSYILHGHIPKYDLSSPHPDAILHEKLKDTKDLLDLDVDYLTEHFSASQVSYSTQALPINALLDTLIRPWGETDDREQRTCIKWEHDPSRAVRHIVIGDATQAGGQWVDNPVEASLDIGTLSYAVMLSLPGYTIHEHYYKHHGDRLPLYLRPSRREMTGYLAEYPTHTGIADSIFSGESLSGISRRDGQFHIASHSITCKHLVLASGIFSQLIPPRPLIAPLSDLSSETNSDPILVIGSGFSAADVIISTPANEKIIHIYKWAPTTSPSPLKGCHPEAYPEYAGMYKKMKMAALASTRSRDSKPKFRRASSTTFDMSRDWTSSYEGLPNTAIVDVRIEESGAVITLKHENEEPFTRRIKRMAYVVGRRGNLDYLTCKLQDEVMSPNTAEHSRVSGQTMREKVNENLEVAKNVFVIGSLTGDSLIRFAYGGCLFAAGRIMSNSYQNSDSRDGSCIDGSCRTPVGSKTASPRLVAMNGLDGHGQSPGRGTGNSPLDRRKDVKFDDTFGFKKIT